MPFLNCGRGLSCPSPSPTKQRYSENQFFKEKCDIFLLTTIHGQLVYFAYFQEKKTLKQSSRTQMLPLNVMIIGQPPITARFRWRARLAFYNYGNGNGITFSGRHQELYLGLQHVSTLQKGGLNEGRLKISRDPVTYRT